MGAYLLLFFTLGAAAQAAQFLLIRELLAVSQGNESSIALLLAVWMAGTAIGSGLGAAVCGRLRSTRAVASLYAVTLLLLLGLLPLSLWLARVARMFFQEVPVESALAWLAGAARSLFEVVPVGGDLSMGQVFVTAAFLSVPVAFLFGWLYPFAVSLCERGIRKHSAASRVYTWEALGAAGAGVLLSVVLVTRVDPFTLALWSIGLHAAAAFLALHLLRSSLLANDLHGKLAVCLLLLFLLSITALLPSLSIGPRIDSNSRRKAWDAFGEGAFELVQTRGSPYGPLAVLRCEDQVTIYQSGHKLFSLPDRGEVAPYAHLALLQSASPRRVLLLHGTYGGALKDILRHPVSDVSCVEQDAALGELALDYVSRDDRRALQDRRVRVVTTDPRRFVRKTQDRFDLIWVMAPEPTTLASNRYFTLEFFEELRRVLGENGLVVLGPLASHGTYADEFILHRNAILLNTLEQCFAEVRVTAGTSCLFLASVSPGQLCLQEAALARLAHERGLPPTDLFWLIEPSYLEKVAYELQTGEPYDPLEEPPAGSARWTEEINRDARPVVCLRTIALWAAQEGDPVVRWLQSLEQWPWPIWAAPIGIVVLLCLAGRGRRPFRRLALGCSLLALGFWGAGIEWVVLVSFQSSYGVLYQWVGGMIGLFMVGLAWGAAAARQRLLARRGLMLILLATVPCSVLVAGLFLAAEAVGGWALGDVADGLLGGLHVAAMTLAGVLVGAGFTAAVGAVREKPEASQAEAKETLPGGIFYAVDVAGGVLGTLLISCILLPGYGSWVTAAVCAGACLAAMLALLSAGR